MWEGIVIDRWDFKATLRGSLRSWTITLAAAEQFENLNKTTT
jgi:hypothetical protein